MQIPILFDFRENDCLDTQFRNANGMAEPSSSAGHRDRLRKRFERTGFTGFAEHEVVELLLTLCIPRRDVKEPAKALLRRFGSLKSILEARPVELREVQGIGQVAPVALRIIREAANLYLQQIAEEGVMLNSTDRLEKFWRSRLGGLKHEVFEVAYLNRRYQLLKDGVERLEEGTIDRAYVYPRKVMEAALRRSSAVIVLAHNHPSGRARPSEEDRVLTDALIQAAEPLQIHVLDHIIVAGDSAFSFKREGML